MRAVVPDRASALLRRLEAEAGRRLPLALGRPREEDVDDDDALARHWLLPGAVVELSALPGAGALSVAFSLALRARARALSEGRPGWLCALDPSSTLSAPALLHLGVPLAELLVVRPPVERLLATATRACRGDVAAVVVDATGVRDLGGFPVPLRRLTLAAEERGTAVVLVTSSQARRSAPLPCAGRALVDATPDGAVLRAVRHRHGLPPRLTLAPPRSVIDELIAELAPRESSAAPSTPRDDANVALP